MIRVYSCFMYRLYLMRKIRKLYKKTQPKIKRLSHGIIANEIGVGYGVFDSKYNLEKTCIQKRKGTKGQIIPKIKPNDLPYIDTDVVYLCHIGRNHFGHFLLEQLSRGWFLFDGKYKDMKVVIVDDKNQGKLPDFVYNVLGMAGIKKENIILLNKTTRFRNVYLPELGFDKASFYTDKFTKMYDKMAENVLNTGVYEKIYVSRCALPGDRRTYGEEKIQNIFQKNGFKIIFPEQLRFEQQVGLIKNCKVLAGCAGTALHLALFMKSGGTVIQIKRNSLLSDNANVQHLINIAKGLNSVFIYGSCETRKTKHWSNIPQIICVTKYMKRFFDENHFVYNQEDLIIDEEEKRTYANLLEVSPNRDTFMYVLKSKFIKISSCLIPSRLARKKYRHFMKECLHV